MTTDIESFDVSAVVIDHDDTERTSIVAFGEHHDGSGRCVVFQQSLSVDAQDIQLGMDRHCVSIESGATVYGGVERITIERSIMCVTFNPVAATTLDAPQTRCLHLRVGPELIDEAIDALRRLLELGRLHLNSVAAPHRDTENRMESRVWPHRDSIAHRGCEQSAEVQTVVVGNGVQRTRLVVASRHGISSVAGFGN